eukprot:TRINITY_DN2108_c0_g1_i2.p1 TRINITY_DN2108_c0_g1~~TRINITY_DN2108_c0_g1_i2.p1  ORF type:complete len:385 (-),score=43.25 TRINITY_DN2108_c0_g1_i2:198-1352(-)
MPLRHVSRGWLASVTATSAPAECATRQRLWRDDCPCEYGLLTPSWPGHFGWLVELTRSMYQHGADLWRLDYLIVVSEPDEVPIVWNRIGGFLNGTIRATILSIGQLGSKFGIHNASDAFFTFRTRGPFQGVKKFYGARYMNCSKVLLLDSESFVVKPMSFVEAFEQYFQDPFVVMSQSDRPDHARIVDASLAFAGASATEIASLPAHVWNFEYYGWFIERPVFLDFWNFIESHHHLQLYEVFHKYEGAFEITTYWWYIYFHRAQYPSYRFVWDYELLEPYLGADGFRNWKSHFTGKTQSAVEFLLQQLNHSNYDAFRRFVTDWNWRMCRVDQEFFPESALSNATQLYWQVPTLTLTVSSLYRVRIHQQTADFSPYTRLLRNRTV